MKKLSLTPILLSVCLFTFSSCRENIPVNLDDKGSAVIINVETSFDSDESKASLMNWEASINRLQIGIYNSAGECEWDNTYTSSFTNTRTVSGLTEGEKTIVAVANKEIVMPATLDEFDRISVSLKDNTREHLVMSGKVKTVACTAPEIATISLRRIVAKISFRNALIVSWNEGKQHGFSFERVYIANVASKSDLNGGCYGEFVNLRENKDISDDEGIRSLTVSDYKSWIENGAYNGGVDFYVCPNVSEDRKTAFIIQAKYDGRTCYYPLVIADEILSNTQYNCGKIVLTCEGMENPEDDFLSNRASLCYTKAEWDDSPNMEDVTF